MGLKELLLRKGRGVGELKNFGTEQALNSNIIKIIKEISAVDREADAARKSKNIISLLGSIRKQMSLLEQVHHFALVKTVRLQYDYKDIEKKLGDFESHMKSEKRRLDGEEAKLIKEMRKGKIPNNPEHIRQQISQARGKLRGFDSRLREMKSSLKSFKHDVRIRCKKKIIKIKKIYHFA